MFGHDFYKFVYQMLIENQAEVEIEMDSVTSHNSNLIRYRL
jgi:hypothetical protein